MKTSVYSDWWDEGGRGDQDSWNSLRPESWNLSHGFAGLLSRAVCTAGGDIIQLMSKGSAHVCERGKQWLV